LQRGFDITRKEQQTGKVPVISSGGIGSYHNIAKVIGPGVVLGRKGVVGSVYYQQCDYWPHDTTLWVKDFHGNDPHFVYYFFKSIARQIASLDVGSANPTLNRNHLHPTRVLWPPLKEQQAIAAILGALDDKIENNRRTNETLEAMARAIFQSWFVDFDPVHAKAAGQRPTGMDDATAALFPDEFQDSALGLIPKGWEVGTLGDVAQQRRDGVRVADIQAGEHYIGLEHMPRRSIALDSWEDGEVITSNKSRFSKGDFLFGKLRPYFHKVGVAPVDGVCSTDIVVVQPMAEDWYGPVLAVITSDKFVDEVTAASTGTKMPRTSWGNMSKFSIVMPPKSIALDYTKIVNEKVAAICCNIHESKYLSTTRDTLLPKLLSGELRVPDAEALVEAAV